MARVKYKMLIFLLSGIPLNIKSSFYWQLTLLNKGFKKRGVDTLLISPIPVENNQSTDFTDNILFVDYKNADLVKIIKDKSPSALLLLGYPEDFPFLESEHFHSAAYLWAQFSKPPNLNDYYKERVNFVPLTEITRRYCVEAGVKNVLDSVPHGIPINIYYPFNFKKRRTLREKMGLETQFVIGTVAKNIIRKRLNDVIEVFSSVEDKIENSKLLIKTDKDLSDAGFNLRFLIKKFNISDKTVIILGDYNRNQLADLYNCMDVYIQLSEWEGFGIPVVEAMACGLPIVTHEVQGPGEIVDGGGIIVKSKKYRDENGAFLSSANIEEAADALFMLYKDKKMRDELSIKAVNIVKEIYDIDIIADKWIEIIKSQDI